MWIKNFTASSVREALSRIKKEMGANAVILDTRVENGLTRRSTGSGARVTVTAASEHPGGDASHPCVFKILVEGIDRIDDLELGSIRGRDLIGIGFFVAGARSQRRVRLDHTGKDPAVLQIDNFGVFGDFELLAYLFDLAITDQDLCISDLAMTDGQDPAGLKYKNVIVIS